MLALLLRRYTIAIFLTLLALGCGLVGRATWGVGTTYSVFLGAVMLSSWLGGLGPGIVSTVLGLIAADYFLVPPVHEITLDAEKVIQLSAFLAIAVAISSLNDARRRALAALERERLQLEERVSARTAELARSERGFRTLIDAAPDAILVIDRDGRITSVNSQTERMFGHPRERLLRHDVEMLIPERFRDAHRAGRQQYGHRSAIRTIEGDLAGLRADGTEFPIEIRISPIDTHDGHSIVGIVRDVTQRRVAEQVQRRLVHDLGERVKELTALHATGRLLNEEGEPRALLQRIVELLPPAWQYPDVTGGRIAFADVDVQTPAFRATAWTQRAEFQTGDGRTGVVEVVYTDERPRAVEGPFLAEERNLIESIASMLRAYFDRLQAAEQRVNLARAEEARVRAQESNDSKDQFLATLSHELRSPLNVMAGWVQLLRAEGVSDDMRARGLDVLDRSVRVQTKLIEDLLDVSRIAAGKLRVDLQRLDLARIASDAVDAVTPAVQAQRVTLTHGIAPSLWMQGDPQRLQQVFTNILTNALKFTPEHGTIDVSVDRAGDWANIVIRDTGIGIDADALPKIFDRFHQAGDAASQSYGGLGLGLAIVKHLVERHGGHVSAASEGRDRGSSFHVSLPLLPVREQPATRSPTALNPSLVPGLPIVTAEDEARRRAESR